MTGFDHTPESQPQAVMFTSSLQHPGIQDNHIRDGIVVVSMDTGNSD